MKHAFLLPALLCLLLPSCVQWDIGGCIREPQTVHKGVDVYHPVNNKVYVDPAAPNGSQEVYIYAPEIAYQRNPKIVSSRSLSFIWGEPDTILISPQRTGNVYLTRIERYGRNITGYADALPLGAVEQEDNAGKLVAQRNGKCYSDCVDYERCGSISRTSPGLARTLAAAPFDYVIDPVLTATTTVASMVPVTCAAVVMFPLCYIRPEWFWSN